VAGVRVALIGEVVPGSGAVDEFVVVDITSGLALRRAPGIAGSSGAPSGPPMDGDVVAAPAG
jgi:hypothetical protein